MPTPQETHSREALIKVPRAGTDPRRLVIGRRYTQSLALTRRLQAALSAQKLDVDVHLLRSGRVGISVAHGLLVYCDGDRLWWARQETSSGLSLHIEPTTAAEHLLKHPAVLARLQPVVELDVKAPL